MEPRIVEYADLTPGSCLLCGASDGPFLEHQTQEFTMPTADGPRLVEGTIYLCLGTAQNPGCLPQAATMIGGASPWQLEAVGDAARERIAELEDQIEGLAEALVEAERNQGPRVVRVDDLLAELGRPGAPLPAKSAPAQPDWPPTPPAPPHPDSARGHEAQGLGLGPGTEDYDPRHYARVTIT